MSDARKDSRYEVALTAEVDAGPRRVRCEVENLSLGGCRVRPTSPLPAGAEVRIRIASPEVPFELSGAAVVVWTSGTPPHRAGLRFAPELGMGAARFLGALLGPAVPST